jgi:hypothetical protein
MQSLPAALDKRLSMDDVWDLGHTESLHLALSPLKGRSTQRHNAGLATAIGRRRRHDPRDSTGALRG